MLIEASLCMLALGFELPDLSFESFQGLGDRKDSGAGTRARPGGSPGRGPKQFRLQMLRLACSPSVWHT